MIDIMFWQLRKTIYHQVGTISILCNIAELYCNNSEEFERLRFELSECGTEYSLMKLMYMCFWQAAYVEDIETK